jgi:hypothetical protein
LFRLQISSPQGVDAEFTVDSASLALDLALRASRSGFVWSAEKATGEPPVRLALDALRRHAHEAARDDAAERLRLDEIEWQHQLLATSRLN